MHEVVGVKKKPKAKANQALEDRIIRRPLSGSSGYLVLYADECRCGKRPDGTPEDFPDGREPLWTDDESAAVKRFDEDERRFRWEYERGDRRKMYGATHLDGKHVLNVVWK